MKFLKNLIFLKVFNLIVITAICQSNILEILKIMIVNMKIRIRNYFLFLTALLSLYLVSCSNKARAEYIRENSYNPSDYLIVWAHSDIQPRKLSERKYYEAAVADMNDNFPKIDIALVAGDIVHWSNAAEDYDWFVKTKGKTSIKYWYEIAGNHDQNNGVPPPRREVMIGLTVRD